jgi:hypothetical protein
MGNVQKVCLWDSFYSQKKFIVYIKPSSSFLLSSFRFLGHVKSESHLWSDDLLSGLAIFIFPEVCNIACCSLRLYYITHVTHHPFHVGSPLIIATHISPHLEIQAHIGPIHLAQQVFLLGLFLVKADTRWRASGHTSTHNADVTNAWELYFHCPYIISMAWLRGIKIYNQIKAYFMFFITITV